MGGYCEDAIATQPRLAISVMESFALYTAQLESPAVTGTPVIAQHFDQDIIGDTGAMLKGFYESGQLWALLIGIALGYAFKSFSSYG